MSEEFIVDDYIEGIRLIAWYLFVWSVVNAALILLDAKEEDERETVYNN